MAVFGSGVEWAKHYIAALITAAKQRLVEGKENIAEAAHSFPYTLKPKQITQIHFALN